MSTQADHEQIINFIFEQFDNEIDEADIIAGAKAKFSIDEGVISWAIEMALTGRFRSGFIRAGKNIQNQMLTKTLF